MTWLSETLYPGWAQSFQVVRELARERSAFQEILVVETASHGRVLLLDGVVQITEADEFAYQEMIAHVPLIQHGAAERVLIIGAGDGGVLRRVLQHRTVQRATMVEIDGAVIRLAREYLPGIGGSAWEDSRANVIVGDGIAYVAAAEASTVDVIIVDSTDPAGPGEVLFSESFYRDCARILRAGGLLVNQCGVPFMQADELRDTTALRARVFAHVSAYVAAVPTYVGGFMALGIASAESIEPVPVAALGARAMAAGILDTTRYWSPAVHAAAFALPPYISAAL
jgi:spermidine synthase